MKKGFSIKGKPKAKRRTEPGLRALRLGFTLCVFIILIVSIAAFAGVDLILTKLDVGRIITLLACAGASSMIGGFLTMVVIRIPMRPIKTLLKGMTRLADGHFEERVDFGEEAPMKEMADAFNALASELQNTEMLRSDFVNHFSHEFKTPIVSIRGFAKRLQRPDLPEEKRREYVDIIVDESNRLANMATNVLNMTKIENQTILNNKERFNLSEQLRRCVLLLEKKWVSKQIEMEADLMEVSIHGDEELLKQVWMNLLDNAIKFSPEGGKITVRLAGMGNRARVSVHNQGPQILPEQTKRIFDKFWQGDASHATEGTGIGLSIVKKIVELHHGEIEVDSTPQETAFTVVLPIKE